MEVLGREVAFGDAALPRNHGAGESGGHQACDGLSRPGNRDEIIEAFRLDRQDKRAVEV